ncbi:hypothetical protein HanIR_Chr14g0718851 [Helianthus annuus]|nr:hypothetical protein HanIR_Chr14g0718851 [Helianthus annuus]
MVQHIIHLEITIFIWVRYTIFEFIRQQSWINQFLLFYFILFYFILFYFILFYFMSQ